MLVCGQQTSCKVKCHSVNLSPPVHYPFSNSNVLFKIDPTTDTALLLATYRGGSHLTSDILRKLLFHQMVSFPDYVLVIENYHRKNHHISQNCNHSKAMECVVPCISKKHKCNDREFSNPPLHREISVRQKCTHSKKHNIGQAGGNGCAYPTHNWHKQRISRNIGRTGNHRYDYLEIAFFTECNANHSCIRYGQHDRRQAQERYHRRRASVILAQKHNKQIFT